MDGGQFRRFLGASIALVLVSCLASGKAAERAKDPDEELLHQAHVTTDAAGLLGFLRQRSSADGDLQNIDRLIQDLGSGDFQEREHASKKLIGVGGVALPALRRADKNPDREIVRRAGECVRAIVKNCNSAVPLAVVRRLVQHRVPKADEALLRYLPYTTFDPELEEEIWFALDALAKGQDKLEPAFVESLKDKSAVRRAAAGYLLGRRGNPDQRAAVRPLLKDADRMVRLRTAQGLLGAKDRTAIPVLVALLEKCPIELSWQAEEMLHWVAGEEAPEATVGIGSTRQREECRRAWWAWWENQGAKVDLAALDQGPNRPGLILMGIGRLQEKDQRVGLYGCDGKPRWQVNTPPGVVQLLPGSRLLIFEVAGQRVTERDLGGKVLWQFKASPVSGQRLPSGNTFIAELYRGIEVTPAGEIVYNREFKTSDQFGYFIVQKLSNGHILCRLDRGPREAALAEFSPVTGAMFRYVDLKGLGITDPYCRIQALPNGHYLIGSAQLNRLFEIDAMGKTCWHCLLPAPLASPMATHLRNGNLLISVRLSDPIAGLVEMDPLGKVVWELPAAGEPSFPMAFGLVRLGFDTPRPADLDLSTSVTVRIKGLQSKDPLVRLRSVLALSRLGPKAAPAIPLLIETLDDSDQTVRSNTWGVFGTIGPASLPYLIKATKDKRVNVRRAVVCNLSGYRHEAKTVVPVLVEALQDESALVRHEAVYSLGHMGPEPPEVIPTLIRALKDKERVKTPEKTTVAQMAAHTLGRFGPKAKAAVPALVEALKSDNLQLRGAALVTLGKIGPDAKVSIPVVLEALQCKDVRDPQVVKHIRNVVAATLADIGGPEAKTAVPAMVEVLKDQSIYSAYRRFAATALGNIGPEAREALPALAEALKDKEAEVRSEVEKAIEKISRDTEKRDPGSS